MAPRCLWKPPGAVRAGRLHPQQRRPSPGLLPPRPAAPAGPLFDGAEHMDFYNLELKDTNVVDHNTHDYGKQGLAFEVVDEQRA